MSQRHHNIKNLKQSALILLGILFFISMSGCAAHEPELKDTYICTPDNAFETGYLGSRLPPSCKTADNQPCVEACYQLGQKKRWYEQTLKRDERKIKDLQQRINRTNDFDEKADEYRYNLQVLLKDKAQITSKLEQLKEQLNLSDCPCRIR